MPATLVSGCPMKHTKADLVNTKGHSVPVAHLQRKLR